ncbi:hypothetical protein FACS1894137_08150 [Spirochaetia bacterium]|nr:hypothetical protein FACS1894137_08150 [Spirochaetia bacterium]
MRQFYLYRRIGNSSFYARFINEAGATLTTRSTQCTSRDEAVFKVSGWLRDGLPPNRKRGNKKRRVEAEAGLQAILASIGKTDTLDADAAFEIIKALRDRGLIDTPAVRSGPGKAGFIPFLEKFWDYEKSEYVREKLAHGQRIGRRHCQEMTNRIHHYWDPAFKNKNLKDITRADLKQFSLSLTGKLTRPENYKGRFPEKLAPAAINKILLAGTIALNWAFHDGQIPINPAERLQRFSGKSQKRGVLTLAEATEIFAATWPDKRAYTGNMIAMICGMRSGEVLALQKEDLSTNGLTINVTHSWSRADGLKSPKNGDERKAPILPGMKSALLNLAGESPWGDTGSFLFYSTVKPDIPMDQKFLIDGLRGAIETVNEARKKKDPAAALIDWKGRNITFHSWRHFYAARMADKMSAEAVARITGHKSKAVFEAYADHIEAENLDLMRDAAAEIFGNIINFAEKTA